MNSSGASRASLYGSAKRSTTTTREQNRALGPQVYSRSPNPGKHRKIMSTIAFARLAKIWSSAVMVDSSVLPDSLHGGASYTA